MLTEMQVHKEQQPWSTCSQLLAQEQLLLSVKVMHGCNIGAPLTLLCCLVLYG